MLNIPDSIKSLYKADGVHKNFRVHFPGGQYPDVTNENVVRESLRFTESVCSRQFKFGLAEASVIEFETVGVGNMYGLTIECSIEIDTTSLSAADLAAIESDPGDGTLVLEEDSDLGFGFYRIPLGTFKVTSCPRNHQQMTHRKVTAYTTYTGGGIINSPYEELKLSALQSGSGYFPNPYRLVYAAFGFYKPELMDAFTVDKTTTVSFPSGTLYAPHLTVGPATITPQVQNYSLDLSHGNLYLVDRLKRMTLTGQDLQSVLDWVAEVFNGDDELRPYASEAQDAVLAVIQPYIWFNDDLGHKEQPVTLTNSQYVAYPKGAGGINDLPPVGGITIPNNAHIEIKYTPTGGTEQRLTEDFPLASSVTLETFADTFPNIALSYKPTASYVFYGQEASTYINAYNFMDLLGGYLEVNGKFGKVSRSGGYVTMELDPDNREEVVPEDYSQGECWWDEYTVDPVGSVIYAYGEDGAAATAEYVFSDGSSSYDMSGNIMLQHLDGAAQQTVEDLIDAEFVAQAAKVGFTPVDLEMDGWPWIEAGDALEITAEDGTVVNTYVLRRELHGIQHLTDTITAENGQIIQSTEVL